MMLARGAYQTRSSQIYQKRQVEGSASVCCLVEAGVGGKVERNWCSMARQR